MKQQIQPLLRKLQLVFKKSPVHFLFLLLALPASSNYEMHDFAFGSGGVGNADSTSYSLNAVMGQTGGDKLVGTTFNLGPGLEFIKQAAVPPAPTFTNPSSHYNKLLLQVNTGSNPSDALYAVAISTDNWVTTNYVQSDNTIGAVLGSEDYQTYVNWGSSIGEYVVGLAASTTYKVKIKAIHGKSTETEYSAEASAATSQVSLTYDIDISASDSESSPPYTIAFGSLAPATVNTASNLIWFDLNSNAEGGAFIYVRGTNNGLHSAAKAYTIPTVSANLTSQSEGYGMRISTTTQSSGGPLAAVAPFVGSGETVGSITTTSQTILNSSSQPISGGRASALVKVKVAASAPASADYVDTITAVASASF